MLETGTLIAHIFLFISLYFEIFLLVTFFEKSGEIRRKTEELISHPSVTIIVPCFNEEKTVSKTVESLLSLDYPKSYLSIFLIDDGSTDSTWDVIKSFEYKPGVMIFRKENGGKYTALNLGIQESKSDLVGCLDADSVVDPLSLKRIVKCFEDKRICAVTPAIQIHNPKNIIELI